MHESFLIPILFNMYVIMVNLLVGRREVDLLLKAAWYQIH